MIFSKKIIFNLNIRFNGLYILKMNIQHYIKCEYNRLSCSWLFRRNRDALTYQEASYIVMLGSEEENISLREKGPYIKDGN